MKGTLKLASFYLLVLIFAVYDQGVKSLKEYSVNLDVLYFSGVYLFILFWMVVAFIEGGGYRDLVLVLCFPILARLILNLMSIGKDYKAYAGLVNNQTIDYITWVGLIIGTLLIIWRRFTT